MFVELCHLDENGRGGFHGVVEGTKLGEGGKPGEGAWIVPDGTKFVLWALGDPRRIQAFLLEAIQPGDVGADRREQEGTHILCKMWKSQGKERYYGKLHSTFSREPRPGTRPWEWELPAGLGFTLFDDRGQSRGFKLKIGDR